MKKDRQNVQPRYKFTRQKASGDVRVKLFRGFVLLLLLCVSVSAEALVNQEVEKPDTLYLGSRFQLRLTSDAEIMDVVVPDTLKAFAVVEKKALKERGKPQDIVKGA